jgi:hypothetical protein
VSRHRRRQPNCWQHQPTPVTKDHWQPIPANGHQFPTALADFRRRRRKSMQTRPGRTARLRDRTRSGWGKRRPTARDGKEEADGGTPGQDGMGGNGRVKTDGGHGERKDGACGGRRNPNRSDTMLGIDLLYFIGAKCHKYCTCTGV